MSGFESGSPVALGENACGKCVVATSAIAAGQVVFRFEGPVVSWAEVPPEEVRYVISFEPYRWLVPEGPARFVNHSCEPNCEVRPTRDTVALRAIAPGEELTISYDRADAADVSRNPDHYFWDERWTFACRCGSLRCRGLIDRYRPE
jgi:hypothetical protein